MGFYGCYYLLLVSDKNFQQPYNMFIINKITANFEKGPWVD